MRKYFTLYFCICTLSIFAQKEATFKVAAHPNIQLIPGIDTIIAGTNYSFMLTGISTGAIQQAVFTGGTVDLIDSGISLYVDTVSTTGEEHLLQLYVSKNGKSVVAFEKKFRVIVADTIPAFIPRSLVSVFPVATFWDDISTQLFSTNRFSKEELQKDSVKLYISYIKDWCSIISFRMRVTCGDERHDYSTKGEKLSADMIKAIHEVTGGCNIMVWDVRYKLVKTSYVAEEQVTGPFEIFVK